MAQLHHLEFANQLGGRISKLLDQANVRQTSGLPTKKARFYIEHAVHHVHDAYPEWNVTDKDRLHFLDLAEICLDEAEKLLKPGE